MIATPITPIAPPVEAEGKKFSIRALSYIIDYIITLIVFYAITFIISMIVAVIHIMSTGEAPIVLEQNNLMSFVWGFLMTLGYYLIFESLYGASPAKLILKMRVVMKNGDPCTFKAALIRGLLRIIDGFFFGLVAYKHMKAPSYCRIGDDSADTIVVDSKSPLISKNREWWWFAIASIITLVFFSIVSLITILQLVR